jgi:hypothetical protein
MTPNIRYVPRGCLVEIDDRRVVFIGGAVSVDQYYRTPGRDWFPEEQPTFKQLERAASHSNVDVVASHESPVIKKNARGMPGIPEKVLHSATNARHALRSVLSELQPKLWLAGHWHQRLSYRTENTQVEVLAHNQRPVDETVYLIK